MTGILLQKDPIFIEELELDGHNSHDVDYHLSLKYCEIASTSYYYEAASVTGDDFIAFVNERKGAVSIATTNEDGSPNLATLVPGITPDGKYLTITSAENQTIKNIEERKLAVFQFYNYQAQEEDKMKRNTGARAIVKYDADKQAELTEQYKPREGSFMLEIVKVIPLG